MLYRRRERKWHELEAYEKADQLGSIQSVEHRYRHDDGGRGILMALLLVPILLFGIPFLLFALSDWIGPVELAASETDQHLGFACLVLAFVAFASFASKRRERLSKRDDGAVIRRRGLPRGEIALAGGGLLLTLYGANLILLGPCPWGLGAIC